MSHKFPVGASVDLQFGHLARGASGLFKVVRQMPVERDGKVLYRVKNTTETFERTVDEDSLNKFL